MYCFYSLLHLISLQCLSTTKLPICYPPRNIAMPALPHPATSISSLPARLAAVTRQSSPPEAGGCPLQWDMRSTAGAAAPAPVLQSTHADTLCLQASLHACTTLRATPWAVALRGGPVACANLHAATVIPARSRTPFDESVTALASFRKREDSRQLGLREAVG